VALLMRDAGTDEARVASRLMVDRDGRAITIAHERQIRDTSGCTARHVKLVRRDERGGAWYAVKLLGGSRCASVAIWETQQRRVEPQPAATLMRLVVGRFVPCLPMDSLGGRSAVASLSVISSAFCWAASGDFATALTSTTPSVSFTAATTLALAA
jgi:hypothetical protein